MTSAEPPKDLDQEDLEVVQTPATPGAEALPTSDEAGASDNPDATEPPD